MHRRVNLSGRAIHRDAPQVQQYGLPLYPAVYLLYDVAEPLRDNRMASNRIEVGSPEWKSDVGVAVYPPENRLARSYDLNPDEAHAHDYRSELKWISPTQFVFLDALGGDRRAVLVDVKAGSSGAVVQEATIRMLAEGGRPNSVSATMSSSETIVKFKTDNDTVEARFPR